MSKDELREEASQIIDWVVDQSDDEGCLQENRDIAIDRILNLLEGEKQKLEEQYIDKDPEVRAAIHVVTQIVESNVPKDGQWRKVEFQIMMKPPKHIEAATLNKEPNKGEDVDG